MTLFRDVGPWTILKLTFLQEYLKAYVTATQSIKNADVCFMDLFAGPGRDRQRETGEIGDGSPLIAMSFYPGFRKFIFVDLNKSFVDQLAQEAANRGIRDLAYPILGDCNLVIDQALKHVPLDGSTFTFIDPEGTDAKWATIVSIAQHKPQSRNKVELFILFPYDMALVRFLARDENSDFMVKVDTYRRIDSVMPDTERWKKVYRARNQGLIDAGEARRRFAYLYWMGLKKLGYKYVVSPRLMTKPDGHPLYFLFFASDHEAGERIMSHVLNKRRGPERPEPYVQLAMEFAEAELLMPSIADPWDFKEGEPWYDDESVDPDHITSFN